MTATPCWQDAEPRIRLETLIETSTLFSGPLDDRSGIRARQDEALIRELMAHTATTAQTRAQAERFYFGSLDFLVSGEDEPKFHLIEMNGTGMAGITTNPTFIINAILSELSSAAFHYPGSPAPLFIVPFSNAASTHKATSGSLHERILCAQALKEGFCQSIGQSDLLTFNHLASRRDEVLSRPTVLVGSTQEIMPALSVEEGALQILKYPVHGVLRDQFCDDIYQKFPSLKERSFLTLNPIFSETADKGKLYERYNQFVSTNGDFRNWLPIVFEHCSSPEDLLFSVKKGLKEGNRLVIKPRARGLAQGIEFFIHPEDDAEIARKIEASIGATDKTYSFEDMGFPYTVCNFVESRTVSLQQHPFYRHKYELRFLLFRKNMDFFALPSLSKICCQRFEPEKIHRGMLLNNISEAKQLEDTSALDFILPLANDETLSILGLERRHLFEICQFATRFVDFLTQERSSA